MGRPSVEVPARRGRRGGPLTLESAPAGAPHGATVRDPPVASFFAGRGGRGGSFRTCADARGRAGVSGGYGSAARTRGRHVVAGRPRVMSRGRFRNSGGV